MNNNFSSCTVAPLTECNHATVARDNATPRETITQPSRLLSLAFNILEKNKSNPTRNSPTTSQLHHAELYVTKKFTDTELCKKASNKSLPMTRQSQGSCMVVFSIQSNYAIKFKYQHKKLFSSCQYLNNSEEY